jgi:hypothetical protein
MRNFERTYPEAQRRRFGNDPEKYIGWMKKNLEYLLFEGDAYDAKPVVDEDVNGLGLSNRKVELLEKCIAMLEQADRPDLASRILKRYTTEDCQTPQEWRSWLEANRRRLFFTDVGGFKFVVAPEYLTTSASRSTAGLPAERAASHPVAASAELLPAKVRTGETLDLVVRVQAAPTWHIYAVNGSNGPGVPTTLALRLPAGIESVGQWACPKPIPGSDQQMIYEGTVEFRRSLRVETAAAPGRIEVACELGYQACDPHACRPPTKAELVATAEVVGNTASR